MYAYRYRHLKKKKINGAVWLGGLLLAVIGILLQTNRSFFAKLGEEGAKSCCEKVLDFYLPGLSYSVKDETEWSFVEKVIDVLFYGENYEPESGSRRRSRVISLMRQFWRGRLQMKIMWMKRRGK